MSQCRINFNDGAPSSINIRLCIRQRKRRYFSALLRDTLYTISVYKMHRHEEDGNTKATRCYILIVAGRKHGEQ